MKAEKEEEAEKKKKKKKKASHLALNLPESQNSPLHRKHQTGYPKMRMTGENSSGNSETTMEDVKNLIKKKDDIEEQIKAYYDVLEDVSLSDNQL